MIGDIRSEERIETLCPEHKVSMVIVNECEVEMFSKTTTFECPECKKRIVITATMYPVSGKGIYPEHNYFPEQVKSK